MKTGLVFAAVMLLVISLLGCGAEAAVNINAAALAADISALYSDGPIELLELDSESAEVRYGIGGLCTSIYCETSVTVSSDEILIAEALGADEAEQMINLLKKYRDERAELFAAYAPSEVPKLEKALLERTGKYVIFVAAEDTSEAEKVWDKYRS